MDEREAFSASIVAVKSSYDKAYEPLGHDALTAQLAGVPVDDRAVVLTDGDAAPRRATSADQRSLRANWVRFKPALTAQPSRSLRLPPPLPPHGPVRRQEERKARLAKLLRGAPSNIALNEHYEAEGGIIYKHACKLGCEGIVSKRLGSPYKSRQSAHWVKVKIPKAPAGHRH